MPDPDNVAPDNVAADNVDPSQSVDEAGETVLAITAEKLTKKRRRRKVILAAVLTGAFVGALIWSTFAMNSVEVESELAIAPSVLFEDLCEKVKNSEDITTVHVKEFEVDDSMMSALEDNDSIETFIVDKGIVTDAAMPTIAALPNLRQLRLRLSPIGDEGFRELSKCPSLMFLNLPQCECTAEGIAALASLPRLRQLRIGSPKLGNDATREIAKIQTLRTVHLIKVPVTDEGLKLLAEMPQLESLYLDDSAVTEAGWAWLFDHHGNLHIHINQEHHDRDPQKHVHHDGGS
ncbi:hypothetical protein [Rubripirellula tenax]|nr:hypothetical protein [Rubripirellula tenax]